MRRPLPRPPGVRRASGLIDLQRLVGNRAAARAVSGVTVPAPVQRYTLRPVTHNDDAHRLRAGQLGSEANVAVAYPTKPDGTETAPVTSWSAHGGDHAEIGAIKKTGIARARGPRVGDWVGRVYTELEPCPRCKTDLGRLLDDDAVVEYTGWYENQWSHAQGTLKTRAKSIAELDFLLDNAAAAGLSTADLQAESARLKAIGLDQKTTPYPRDSVAAGRAVFAAGAATLYRALLTAELGRHPAIPGDQSRSLLYQANDTRHYDKYLSVQSKIREQARKAAAPTVPAPARTSLAIPRPRTPTPALGPFAAATAGSGVKRGATGVLDGQPPAKQARTDPATTAQIGYLTDLARKHGTRFTTDYDRAIAGTGLAARQAGETINALLARLTRPAASTLINLLTQPGTTLARQ
ncbi:nucleic acid/nucleotide deaminase of polymorphic system toxin [Actinokineospora cianjurensis]|uniref:Nucleic acid/nucleotide deaminase of polymorphic system toxin n=1 Tax=Actinokineospora cianjurensis TaxID=585224 RepID=A0A421AV35_9PSEU|nr:nucleic acid/nucleotide deaminase of polymorphic system toxin [Actinokineospora cianjurensis]